jgi:hypothetical protein
MTAVLPDMDTVAAGAKPRRTIGERAVHHVTSFFGKRSNRRSFLVRTAVVGSALAANPVRYVLRPGTAYAAATCGPAADCASGWTVFCCSVNNGRNTCPPGSVPAGWWKSDNSGFCGGGPRYILDCNATCGSCGCGSSGICAPGCYNCGCRCGTGSCDRRRHCCNQFRYGQCHQELRCVGPVVCRVATCAPPWRWDPTCTRASATANETSLHTAPCLSPQPPPTINGDADDMRALIDDGGAIYLFGPGIFKHLNGEGWNTWSRFTGSAIRVNNRQRDIIKADCLSIRVTVNTPAVDTPEPRRATPVAGPPEARHADRRHRPV